MRVAFLTNCPWMYGANRSLLNLIDGLRSYDVQSFVVSSEQGEVIDALTSRKIPIKVVPFPWMGVKPNSMRGRLRRIQQALRALNPLVKVLRRWNADVVYSNSSAIGLGALAAKLLRRPHVWHLREFGDLDYQLTPEWGRFIYRRLLRAADAQIAVSHAVLAHQLEGTTGSNAHVIYNGVASAAEFDAFRERARGEKPSEQEFTFAMVGLIHPAKRQEDAVRAMALVRKRFPETRLVIVGGFGERDYYERCRALVTDLGLAEVVKFPGFVNDPFGAYFSADAALMCSWHEGLGRATLEAMACCRPVIGFDQAGTSEVIEHERTGLLYRGGAPALAECMARLIANRTWSRELGMNAWESARQKYTVELCASRVYAVLDGVCPTPGRFPAVRSSHH